jgi:hypothetical protein
LINVFTSRIKLSVMKICDFGLLFNCIGTFLDVGLKIGNFHILRSMLLGALLLACQ